MESAVSAVRNRGEQISKHTVSALRVQREGFADFCFIGPDVHTVLGRNVRIGFDAAFAEERIFAESHWPCLRRLDL